MTNVDPSLSETYRNAVNAFHAGKLQDTTVDVTQVFRGLAAEPAGYDPVCS